MHHIYNNHFVCLKSPRGPRPSPTASASEYEEGTIMMGNDGTNYIVKVCTLVNLCVGFNIVHVMLVN